MKPIILMKTTLAYLIAEANAKNTSASELITYFETMNIVDKETYLVLTDKIIADETS